MLTTAIMGLDLIHVNQFMEVYMTTEADSMEKLTYTIAETAKVLGVGKNRVYEGVSNGSIPGIRLGGRWIIPKFALHRMLETGRLNPVIE